MPKHTSPKDTKFKLLVLRAYSALIIAGGILTLRSLLSIPKEAGSVILFGLSPERLLMAGGVVLISAVGAGLLLQSWLQPFKFDAFRQRLETKIRAEKIWGSAIGLCIIGIISGSSFVLQTAEISEPFTQAYFIRLQPLILWVLILCAQTLLALPLMRYGFALRQLKPKNRIAYNIAMLFGLFVILWGWIGQSGYGITANDVGTGWNYLGAPVLETQALPGWVIMIGSLMLSVWVKGHIHKLPWAQRAPRRADMIISGLLWITAFILWMSIPLTPSWFAAPPGAPNFEFYPNSDASLYDISAQNVLIGEGFITAGTPFAIRPMYTLFLTLFHAISGLAYEPIIWMQVALLALLPICIYWLTRLIHSRAAGVLAAILIIFREANAIALGDKITVSHAKLLMSDLPTTLGVLLFLLVVTIWLKSPSKRQTLPLAAGGIMGAFMLIRPEFGVLLPFVGLATLLQLTRRRAEWLKSMLLITTGLILMLAPWVSRNYQITGTIFLDSPQYRADLFAKRYRADPIGVRLPTPVPTPAGNTAATIIPQETPNVIAQPGETTAEYTERMAGDVAEYALQNPGAIAQFVTNHFFNSQIQTVLYLPATNRIAASAIGYLGHKSAEQFWGECCSPENYIRRLPFWHQWDGSLPRQSIVPLAINLLLIATGICIAWQRQKFIGLLPLFASTGYILINAAARNSGGRYILPVDWVGIFYYSIGLAQISIWMLEYFKRGNLPRVVAGGEPAGDSRIGADSRPAAVGSTLGIAASIFILGCVLPVTEKAIPERYTGSNLEARFTTLLQPESTSLAANEIETLEFFVQEGGIAIQGRALYPRYHTAEQSESGSTWPSFYPRPYSRISLYLVGPQNNGVILPFTDPPEEFPHGADVLLFGCPGPDYFDAMAVVIYSDEGKPEEILWRSPWPDYLACPLSPPQ
ncbi:MAG: hypothetical protein ABIG63_01555 [Chloroflexota bacterium]